jgi:hypothetical protein
MAACALARRPGAAKHMGVCERLALPSASMQSWFFRRGRGDYPFDIIVIFASIRLRTSGPFKRGNPATTSTVIDYLPLFISKVSIS